MKNVGRISRSLFERVRMAGKRLPGTPNLQGIFLPESSLPPSLAIVCPKSVATSAVIRNSLRRRIRGRINQVSNRFTSGALIIFARSKVKNLNSEELNKECVEMLSQASRLSK